MLKIHLAALIPSPVKNTYLPWNNKYPHLPQQQPQTHSTIAKEEKPKIGLIYFDAIKRDKLIRDAVKSCTYKVGDVCVQAKGTKEEIENRGDVRVRRIAQNYTQYGPETDWPKHNRPLIVLGSYIDKDSNEETFIYCSVDYLKKKI